MSCHEGLGSRCYAELLSFGICHCRARSMGKMFQLWSSLSAEEAACHNRSQPIGAMMLIAKIDCERIQHTRHIWFLNVLNL